MRRLLRSTILAGASALAVVLSGGATTNASTPFRYVALGDSFSSGEGDPPYRAASNTYLPPHDVCHRSYHAYPQLVADRLGMQALSFWACSGTRIRDMTSPNRQNPVEKAQLDRVAPPGKSDPSVALITLTLGGNDAQFNVVWMGCLASHLVSPLDGACRGNWRAFVESAIARLRTTLPGLFAQLRARAPRARILVLGYPDPFPAKLPTVSRCNLWFAPSDITWLGREATALNDTIRAAVTASGVTYVAPTGFTGHDVCSRAPWFNDLRLEPGRIRGSFHPNVLGQRQLARDVLAAL